MKRINLLLSIGVMAISICTSSFTEAAMANTPLSNKISEIINSDDYIIRASYNNYLFDYEDSKNTDIQNTKKNEIYKFVTIARKNKDRLYIQELFRHRDDLSYGANCYYKKGDMAYASIVQTMQAAFSSKLKPKYDRRNIKTSLDLPKLFTKINSKDMMVKSKISSAELQERAYRFFIAEFFNVFMDTISMNNSNTAVDGEGNRVADRCTVYSQTGSEIISGKLYEYEEYKTPNSAKYPAVCRFYFENGNLVRVVRIIKHGIQRVRKPVIMSNGMTGFQIILRDVKGCDVMEFSDFSTGSASAMFDLMKG